MVFHENCLLADDSHEISYLTFSKIRKDVKKFVVRCSRHWPFKGQSDFQQFFFVKSQFSVFLLHCSWAGFFKGVCDYSTVPLQLVIPRRSRRDIVLASSVHPFCLSVHSFCLSGTISQYLLVRFDSFLVQMIRHQGIVSKLGMDEF